MIVDDGNQHGPHRKNILNKNYVYVGISHYNHKNHQHVCVINFATSFK